MTDTKRVPDKNGIICVIPELHQLKINNVILQELSSIPELQQLNIKSLLLQNLSHLNNIF